MSTHKDQLGKCVSSLGELMVTWLGWREKNGWSSDTLGRQIWQELLIGWIWVPRKSVKNDFWCLACITREMVRSLDEKHFWRERLDYEFLIVLCLDLLCWGSLRFQMAMSMRQVGFLGQETRGKIWAREIGV